MPADPGPTTILFRGQRIPRVYGFVDLRALTCPAHHRMRETGLVREDGGWRCTHRPSSHEGECGAIVWVLRIPDAGAGKGRFFAADITLDEHQFWQREQFSVPDVLRYVGAWFLRPNPSP
jgi:hypothetical protein